MFPARARFVQVPEVDCGVAPCVLRSKPDEVFAAIEACHRKVHEMGAPRIATTLKLGTRVDREQSMTDRVRSVEEKLKDNS